MRHIESKIQADIVFALSALGVYCLMIPNGEVGKLSPQRYMRLVSQGFRRGASDLILFSNDTPPKAFFLEIKQPKGKQSPGQIDFQKMCKKRGWEYKIAECVEDAIMAAAEWGLIPPESAKTVPNSDVYRKTVKLHKESEK